MNLKTYIAEEQDLDIIGAIDAALDDILLTEGGLEKGISKSKQMFKTRPGLIVAAAALALTARSVYRKYERNTIKFNAASEHEKRMISDIVDTLTRGGKFRVHKITNKNGMRFWKLKRT